jgi:uncharacterized protein (TIGR00661 family)
VTRPKVLISPLNWGLGHAARCIPIIQELISNGCQVIIAAEGGCLQLLRSEFPKLPFLDPPAYKIEYSNKSSLLKWKLVRQIPSIIKAIKKEHKWLKFIIHDYDIDLVISDNRFGMHTKAVPCIYITHQLQIKSGNSFAEFILRRIHYSVIKKFDQCWVPDDEDNGIAGELSHPSNLPSNARYIGPISRLENRTETKLYDLLIILSGPEPQRTLLENILIQELQSFKGKCIFIRGTQTGTISVNSSVEIINMANASQVNQLIARSETVISRSGYTTVMDLIKLKKKAILIPTPGQTEQEYLGKYLMEKGILFSCPQENFSLPKALEQFQKANLSFPEYNWNTYKKVIEQTLNIKQPTFAI